MMSRKLIKYYTVKIEGKPARISRSSAFGTLFKIVDNEEDAAVFDIDFNDPKPEDKESLRKWRGARKREMRIVRSGISRLWRKTKKVSDEVERSWFSDSPNHKGLILDGGMEVVGHYEE